MATNFAGGHCGTESPGSGMPWWHQHPLLIGTQVTSPAAGLLTRASTASSKTGTPHVASAISNVSLGSFHLIPLSFQQ